MQRKVLQAPPSKDVGRLAASATLFVGFLHPHTHPHPLPLLVLLVACFPSPAPPQTHRPKRDERRSLLGVEAMISLEASLLLFLLCQAFSLPVPTQLSKEDETVKESGGGRARNIQVIKCISEILADTLSRSSPMPVTSNCMKVLREDDRVLTMLHHRHLLTELEELAHQENTKHLLAQESNPNSREEKQQGELKKRGEPDQQEETAPDKVEEHAGGKKEEKKKKKEEVMMKEEEAKTSEEKTEVSRDEEGRGTPRSILATSKKEVPGSPKSKIARRI
ncbi:hypothetical protein E2320_000794 [Naja naja]|nr:hypothetical protein E2320_000794 [Naja naja]